MSARTHDPGLQPERTALAWQRTLLSSAGVGALVGFAAVRLGSPVVAVLAAALVAVSGGLLGSRVRDTWSSVRRATWLVVALGLAGLGLALQVAIDRG